MQKKKKRNEHAKTIEMENLKKNRQKLMKLIYAEVKTTRNKMASMRAESNEYEVWYIERVKKIKGKSTANTNTERIYDALYNMKVLLLLLLLLATAGNVNTLSHNINSIQ